jgi:hypothetical protein
MTEKNKLIQMKSSDSGKTVEETKLTNLQVNCTEEMLNKLAVAGNYPNLITISYVTPAGRVECWWEVTPRFPFDDVDIALDSLSKDIHKKFVDPNIQRPKIVRPPRRRKR